MNSASNAGAAQTIHTAANVAPTKAVIANSTTANSSRSTPPRASEIPELLRDELGPVSAVNRATSVLSSMSQKRHRHRTDRRLAPTPLWVRDRGLRPCSGLGRRDHQENHYFGAEANTREGTRTLRRRSQPRRGSVSTSSPRRHGTMQTRPRSRPMQSMPRSASSAAAASATARACVESGRSLCGELRRRCP
jgi:hypothetical protein